MTHQTIQLSLTLDLEPDLDNEALEQLTRQLRQELLELDLKAVEWMTGGALPVNAKTGDPITWGTLLLTLAASGGAITALIGTLQAWLTRHDRRSLTLEIGGDKLQVTGITTAKQQHLIDAWPYFSVNMIRQTIARGQFFR